MKNRFTDNPVTSYCETCRSYHPEPVSAEHHAELRCMAKWKEPVKASTPNLWAPLVTPARGKPWIHPDCICRLRKDARAAYLALWAPHYQRKALKNVRFVRVTVTEQ